VFCVDELVVFDDDPSKIPDYIPAQLRRGKKSKADILNMIEESEEAWKNPDQFLFHVLSFAECPPHLGTDLFPLSPNLQWAGMLPSLDMPHHLKKHEWCQYREGVALGPVPPTGTRSSPRSKHTSHGDEKWTYVKCGLPYPIKIPAEVPEGMRVTLRFANAEQPPLWPNLSQQKCEDLEVAGVDVSTPRVEGGYYWGYTVRRANCISDIFELCPFEGGYDVSIGTSERGAPLNAILPEDIIPWNSKKQKGIDRLPAEFKHLLIVFGGVAGLEPAVATDPVLGEQLTKETAHEAFDAWVNLVQGQGSRTIRTEEAIEFGLFGLKGYMDSMYE
jgi:predicted SPOUT superfamily RNA methylase MTH1